VVNFAESPSEEPRPGGAEAAAPVGDVYDWYVRGRDLLSSGNAAAAAQILSRTVEAEPHARSAREMLARAQFDARQYAQARESFAYLVERDPADHYAHFGLGLSARKLGELSVAVEHLALAAAMRPDLTRYARELRAARAAAARR
jgi:tetratricopeptide (TPR) repeat protein